MSVSVFVWRGENLLPHLAAKNGNNYINTLSISSFPWHSTKKFPALFHETFLSSRPAEQKREIQGSLPPPPLPLWREEEKWRREELHQRTLLFSSPLLSRMEKSKKSGRKRAIQDFSFFSSFLPLRLAHFWGRWWCSPGRKREEWTLFLAFFSAIFRGFLFKIPTKRHKKTKLFCWAGRDFFPFYILISLFFVGLARMPEPYMGLWGHLFFFVSAYWRANTHISVRKNAGLFIDPIPLF